MIEVRNKRNKEEKMADLQYKTLKRGRKGKLTNGKQMVSNEKTKENRRETEKECKTAGLQ